MPAVPFAPGVPPLTSYLVNSVVLLVTDAILSILGTPTQQWGLYSTSGFPVILADSVISFEYSQDFLVSDYQTEKGGFESYDKVRVPFTAKLRFATGGSVSHRQRMLDSIASIIGDTNLYDAVTPEEIYQSVNLIHQDFRRTASQGLGLVSVDVTVREVRTMATTQFSNTQQPSGANAVSGGNVSAGVSQAPPSGFQ